MEVAMTMKRLMLVSGILLLPLLAAHLVLAAGFFKVGEKAPTFTLTAITGESVSLDAYKGKVVVLGLFHICDPCMMQGSNLQKVSEMTKGKEVVVIGVNSAGNSKTDVGEFLSAFPVKVTYPYLLDPGKTTDKLYGGGKFIPNVYEDLAVLHALDPLDVEDVLDVLQERRDPLEPVSELRSDGPHLEAARLLEVGVLGDLLPVAPDLPAEPPGAQRRALPVVLDEPDVVVAWIDPDRLERPEIELLHVWRIRFQNYLELVVLIEPVRVLAVAAVGGAPGRLHVGHVPRLGTEHPQVGRGVHGPGADLEVVTLGG